MWLSHDLPVSAGREFVRYEEDKDGVTAYFKDGSSARGALLVGGDGAHSHVRDILIGADHRPVLSAYVPIFGQTKLCKPTADELRKLGNAVILLVLPVCA
jgi:2-polyprenyl-6-methoxyphenol hydroxylase-like FAD-dependent oxidoreductase